MGRRAGLPEHLVVRAAAAPGLGRAATDRWSDWRAGRTSWEPWADSVSVARNRFAGLVGVDPATVATGAAVSQLLAPVAAAVPDGTTRAGAGRGVHLERLPVGGARRSWRHRADRPRRSARRRHRTRRGRGRLLCGAVGDRRGGRHRGDQPRRARRRRADRDGHLPGDRLVAGRPGRRRPAGLRGLQMAVQPARHRLPGAPSDPRRHGTPASPPGSDRSRRVGSPARSRTSRTTGRRCGWPGTPAGSTSRRPGIAGSAPPPPCRCWRRPGRRRSASTTSRWPTAFSPRWINRRRTPPS